MSESLEHFVHCIVLAVYRPTLDSCLAASARPRLESSIGTAPHIEINYPLMDMEGHNELSNYCLNGSFALSSCPSNWTVSVSLYIVRLLPRINCTPCAIFSKHFAIFSLSSFRNQFSLIKVA